MGRGGAKREIIYLSLDCHHQNDSCIKMGSDESHFNVSLTVRDKVTRRCPQTTAFKEKGEPKRIRTEVLLLTSLTALRLGQTGCHVHSTHIQLIRDGDGGGGGGGSCTKV